MRFEELFEDKYKNFSPLQTGKKDKNVKYFDDKYCSGDCKYFGFPEIKKKDASGIIGMSYSFCDKYKELLNRNLGTMQFHRIKMCMKEQ